MKRLSGIILFLFLFFVAGNCVSLAASPAKSGVTVIPSETSVTLSGGHNGSVDVFYTNNTNREIDLHLSTVDFGSLNDTGGIAFLGNNANSFAKQYGLSQWMVLEKDFLVLAPHAGEHVTVTVQNQESLSPGGHYGAVLAKMEVPTNNRNKKSILLQSTLSSLLFVKKTGGGIYQLDLNNTDVERNWYQNIEGVSLRLQNSGNIHVIPRGYIELTDPAGRMISRGIINEGSGIILPESFRIFDTPLRPVAFPYRLGAYHISTHFRFDGRVSYTTKNMPVFYIPPVWLAALGFLLLALVIFFFYRRNKTYGK